MSSDKSKLETGKPRGQALDQKGHLPKEVKGNAWFLGIGIDSYHHFPPLQNAVKDVKDLIGLLQERYGFKPEHTVLLFNEQATRKNIIEALDSLEAKVKAEDHFIFYFSGHGHLKKFGEAEKGYWIPVDAQSYNTVAYIRNNTIRDYLETINSMHTLLLSDSCFSGSLFISRSTDNNNLALDELENRRSRWAICSGRHDEEVFDGRPGQNSPFSQSLLYELRQNQSSRYNVAKLADRVTKSTRANYKQLPIGSALYGVGHQGGEFVFHLQITDQDFWNKTSELNTIIAYNDYLQTYPDGKYTSEALDQIQRLEEEAEWDRVRLLDRIYNFQRFLRRFPGSRYAKRAAERIAELEKTGQGNIPPPDVPPNEKISNKYGRYVISVLGVIAFFAIVAWWLPGRNTQYGELKYQGRTYRTIGIDGLTWLADDLAVDHSYSIPVEKLPSSVYEYGRLYQWEAAQQACMQLGDGWRLPKDGEWKALINRYGDLNKNNGRQAYPELFKHGESQLDIVLAGYKKEEEMMAPGEEGIYWSGTIANVEYALSYDFFGLEQEIYRAQSPKADYYSCRCVKK